MTAGRGGILREMQGPLAGVAAVVGYGIVGYVLFGHGLLDAVHRTALVLTTVGFSSAEPLSEGEKLFTASVAIFGVAAFLAALAFFTGALVEGRFGRVSRRRRMDRRIGSLKDHLVGKTIARAAGRATPLVVRRAGGDLVPNPEPDVVVAAGDLIVLLGEPTALRAAESGGRAGRARRSRSAHGS